MENRVNLFDIIITVLLVIAACFGIGFAAYNRVDKGSGEITLENYSKYLSVKCSLSRGMGGSPYSMQYDYVVSFSPASSYRLKNVTVQYTLASEYSDIDGTYSGTFEVLEGTGKVEGKVTYEYPKDLSSMEVAGMFPEIQINVVSVSGTYEYIG